MITHADLETKASILAGTPVTIVCSVRGYINDSGTPLEGATVEGYVKFVGGVPEPIIHLRPANCRHLLNLGAAASRTAYSGLPDDKGFGPEADDADGTALATLQHEAFHIKLDSTDEGYVECQNYKNRWAALKVFRPMKRWIQQQIYWGMKLDHLNSLPEYQEVC